MVPEICKRAYTLLLVLGVLVLAIWLTSLTPVDAETPEDTHEPALVKDINVVSYGSDPREIVTIDDTAYYVANYRELWRSDGSLQLTELVKDFVVGGDSSMGGAGGWQPHGLTVMNGALFFSAEDADHGRELWRSDGSGAGTAMVADINPGISGSWPKNFVVLNDTLYFTASEGINGAALWRSDGTEAGTTTVTTLPSEPYPHMIAGDGELFFVDETYPLAQLWRSDGTEAGTMVVKTFDLGSGGASPAQMTYLDGMLYFAAGDSSQGRELWRSDGTEPGTVLLKDLVPGPDSSDPGALVGMSGTLYFSALHSDGYRLLWRSDGTEAGTAPVHGAQLYAYNYDPIDTIVAMDGVLYFVAWGPSGQALWRSDGTEQGTSIVADVFADDPYDVEYHQLTGVAGNLYFAAEGRDEGPELWLSDGTAAGTRLVKDILPGPEGAAPYALTAAGSHIFFSADDGSHGRELWHSDGTEPGTLLLRDINTLTYGAHAYPLASDGNSVYLVADDGVRGRELWRTNGTPGGTGLIKDVWPGADCRGNENDCQTPAMVDAGDFMFTTLNDGEHGWELWRSDGTQSGTRLVKDIFAGPQSSIYTFGEHSAPMIVIDGILYLAAEDGMYGTELWRSDGTESGTWMVKNIAINMLASGPSNFVELDGLLYFTATTDQHGVQLWRSDGTESGTWMVSGGNGNGASDSVRGPLTVMNGAIYFVGFDATHGAELWRSDGTTSGTHMVKDIDADYGALQNFYNGFEVHDDSLFFFAYTQLYENSLWTSDGTEAGTVLVSDVDSIGWMEKLVSSGEHVFFTQDTSGYGMELWRSDGTEAGTVMVKDIHDGANSSLPERLTTLGSLLYFTADDGVHGTELWRSDGTDDGTWMVADLGPESSSIPPHALLAVEDTLYFAADDGDHGIELWRLGPPLPIVAIDDANMSGPAVGAVGETYTMTVNIAPLSATLPITFEWEATAQSTLVRVVSDYSDTVTFSWQSEGVKEVTLHASNASGLIATSLSMLVVDGAVVELFPGTASTLRVDENGLVTTIAIPPGAVAQPAALVYRSNHNIMDSDDLLFGGRAFELTVYRDGASVPGFQFLDPLTLTLPYRQQDVTEIDEEGLKLYSWQVDDWSDAGLTCAPSATQDVDTVDNVVTASFCRSSQFALFGPPDASTLFLPVFVR